MGNLLVRDFAMNGPQVNFCSLCINYSSSSRAYEAHRWGWFQWAHVHSSRAHSILMGPLAGGKGPLMSALFRANARFFSIPFAAHITLTQGANAHCLRTHVLISVTITALITHCICHCITVAHAHSALHFNCITGTRATYLHHLSLQIHH